MYKNSKPASSGSLDSNEVDSDDIWDNDDSNDFEQDDDLNERMYSECLNVCYYDYLQAFEGLSHYLAEIDIDFLSDRFNQTGLQRIISRFDLALKVIIDQHDYCRLTRVMPCSPQNSGSANSSRISDSCSSSSLSNSSMSSGLYPFSSSHRRRHFAFHKPLDKALETDAFYLYGALHARYIISPRGLAKMAEKYRRSEFGRCLRVGCQDTPLVPIGTSDCLFESAVRMYCPCCQDIYFESESSEYDPAYKKTWKQNFKTSKTSHPVLDGAFFGTSFPFLLFMQHPTLLKPPRPLDHCDAPPTLPYLEAANIVLSKMASAMQAGGKLVSEPDDDARTASSSSSVSTLGNFDLSAAPQLPQITAAVEALESKLPNFVSEAEGSPSTAYETSNKRLLLMHQHQVAADYIRAFILQRHVPKLFGFKLHRIAKLQREQDQLYEKICNTST